MEAAETIKILLENHLDGLFHSNTGVLDLEQLRGLEITTKTLRLLQGKATEITENTEIAKIEQEVANLSDEDLLARLSE